MKRRKGNCKMSRFTVCLFITNCIKHDLLSTKETKIKLKDNFAQGYNLRNNVS